MPNIAFIKTGHERKSEVGYVKFTVAVMAARKHIVFQFKIIAAFTPKTNKSHQKKTGDWEKSIKETKVRVGL